MAFLINATIKSGSSPDIRSILKTFFCSIRGLAFGTVGFIAPSFPNSAQNGAYFSPNDSRIFSEKFRELAQQSGILLDTFHQSGDSDDTASLNRACAADVPILLGPRTYQVHDFTTATAGCSTFILQGQPHVSTIQRDSADSTKFFEITSPTVYISGVTFDMNKTSVRANQWGVIADAGGQTVSIRNNIFINNSGPCLAIIGRGPKAGGRFQITKNEVSECASKDIYLGSVTNGDVSGNYVHDSASNGIVATADGTVSATNYISNVTIHHNTVAREHTGIGVGEYNIPYSFSTIPAQYIDVHDNTLIDNSGYGASEQGFDLSFVNNRIVQTSPSVKMFGGFDALATRLIVTNNEMTTVGVPFGIDVGGSNDVAIRGNTMRMSGGSCFNVGGSAHTDVSDNRCSVTGAIGINVLAVESDGSSVGGFPTVASDIAIYNNTINIIGGSATGVQFLDNPGGFSGAGKMSLKNNHFVLKSGAVPSQAVNWLGTYDAAEISNNDVDGSTLVTIDRDGSGYIAFDTVYFGDTLIGASPSPTINGVLPTYLQIYGTGGSVLWVAPTTGGSNYTAATILSASGTGGGSGWTGTAILNNGVIVGVRTQSFGSGYSGTVSVTATDAGGGSGAIFLVGRVPQMPQSTIQYQAKRQHLLRNGSGIIPFYPSTPVWLQVGMNVRLAVQSGGLAWLLENYHLPSFDSGNLPVCNANVTPAQIVVTGSNSRKWLARCDGKKWIYADGSAPP